MRTLMRSPSWKMVRMLISSSAVRLRCMHRNTFLFHQTLYTWSP